MKPRLESDLVKQCLQYLQMDGWKCWRNNTGARPWTDTKGHKRIMRFGAIGSGDIFALKNLPGRGGVFVSVECKRDGNKPTADQEAWAKDVELHGGVALVVHTVHELIEDLADLTQGR